MTETDKPARRPKPLRRTAWSLLAGGLVTLALMVGAGLLLLAGGQDLGPGRSAVWPAGERASVHKHPGPQDDADQGRPPDCEVTGPDGRPEPRYLDWAESVRSPIEVTITCQRELIFLTGPASAVVSAFQSPLIVIPIAAAVVGVFLFFPRFILTLAWLSNPGSRRHR